ncbi:hypothetical protein [Paludibacterium purpuratum]|nr:hypothetical protein [Paludibacterium purpuratum]
MKKMLMAFALTSSLLACFSWAAQSAPTNRATDTSQSHGDASGAASSSTSPAQGNSATNG